MSSMPIAALARGFAWAKACSAPTTTPKGSRRSSTSTYPRASTGNSEATSTFIASGTSRGGMTPKGRSRCKLLSLTEQWASIGQRRFHFREGETIHTESVARTRRRRSRCRFGGGSNPGCAESRCCDANRAVRGGLGQSRIRLCDRGSRPPFEERRHAFIEFRRSLRHSAGLFMSRPNLSNSAATTTRSAATE